LVSGVTEEAIPLIGAEVGQLINGGGDGGEPVVKHHVIVTNNRTGSRIEK
jgi:hypothetical protein